MEGYDLELSSYSLEELLGLFNIELPITDLDLERAKRKALKTHPDKSGLNKDVFIFFKSAFDKLKTLYDIQISQNRESAEEYEAQLEERNEGIAAFSKAGDFNAKFNRLFEENISAHSEDGGHGKWLSETRDTTNTTTQSQFKEMKKKSRALAVVNDVSGYADHRGSELLADADNSGASGGLRFQDVRRAYTESLIPVTEEEDYLSRKQYSGVDELQAERVRVVSTTAFANHEQKLKAQRERESMLDVEMAFKLQQQDETRRRLGINARGRLLQIQGK